MTWQRYNKNLRKSPLLAEYFSFWTNSTPIWGFFEMMRSFGIHVRSFRADCGSYSEYIVKMVMEQTEKFYIRAERYAGLYEKVKRQTGWTTVEIGFQHYGVQSFPFKSFEDVKHCRLVVLSLFRLNNLFNLFPAYYFCAGEERGHRHTVQSVQHEVLTRHQQVGYWRARREYRHHGHGGIFPYAVCGALRREVVVTLVQWGICVYLLRHSAQAWYLCFRQPYALLGRG